MIPKNQLRIVYVVVKTDHSFIFIQGWNFKINIWRTCLAFQEEIVVSSKNCLCHEPAVVGTETKEGKNKGILSKLKKFGFNI
jgi:hypothetical protein